MSEDYEVPLSYRGDCRTLFVWGNIYLTKLTLQRCSSHTLRKVHRRLHERHRASRGGKERKSNYLLGCCHPLGPQHRAIQDRGWQGPPLRLQYDEGTRQLGQQLQFGPIAFCKTRPRGGRGIQYFSTRDSIKDHG